LCDWTDNVTPIVKPGRMERSKTFKLAEKGEYWLHRVRTKIRIDRITSKLIFHILLLLKWVISRLHECDTMWAGLVWILARCLLSPCDHCKDHEASRTSGNILTTVNWPLVYQGLHLVETVSYLWRIVWKCALVNGGNSSHVEIQFPLSRYRW